MHDVGLGDLTDHIAKAVELSEPSVYVYVICAIESLHSWDQRTISGSFGKG